MKSLVFLSMLLLLSGCSAFNSTESSMTEPRLLKQSPLPPIPLTLANQDIEIVCEMLIAADGSIKKASILKGSGDETWDYLASKSLMDWEYSPAILDGQPIQILVKRKIKVMYAEPQSIPLSEIVLNELALAESVYNDLVAGADFNTLALKYSVSPTKGKGGYLGKVDIKYYTKDIRSVLSELNEDKFTPPLNYGEHFIIFKRLKEQKEEEIKFL